MFSLHGKMEGLILIVNSDERTNPWMQNEK